MVEPTAKYKAYRAEIEALLASDLSQRARKSHEFELSLLQRSQFIELNGIVHHYQDVGPQDGEPLVLVHGWNCSAFWWHHIVDPLAAAGYRVILYDLKGHGFSDNDPQQNYTVEGFSLDLLALGNALGLKKQHLAAFSLGAFIILHYAATFPEHVQSLAFFNFSLLAYNKTASAIAPSILSFIFNSLLRPIARRGWWFVPFIYARLVMAKNTPPVNDMKLGTLGVRLCDADAVGVSVKELARQEILEAVPHQMAALKQPVLLVAGDSDPIMHPKGGQQLAALAEKSVFFKVPRCGHLILFELPALVVQILRLHLGASKYEKTS